MEYWVTKYLDVKSIAPTNKLGEPHGHWIAYHMYNSVFWFECDYINGVEYGYEKWANGQTFYNAR